MSDFQDVGEKEYWREYIARVYNGDVRAFYKAFEENPSEAYGSAAWSKFYVPAQHIAMMFPKLLVALKR